MSQLNIPNEEAYQLALELAAERDTSVTELVLDLLRKERERRQPPVRTRAQYDYWRKVAQDNRSNLTRPLHSSDIDALLYDERGLPK